MSRGSSGSGRTDFSRPTTIALIVAAAGLAGCAAGGVMMPSRFFPGYLVGFLFWTGIGVGCLLLTMLHHLVGGGWGLPIRRPMEAGAMTMPIMAVAFVPVALGLKWIYPWIDPATIEEHKRPYLNPQWFDIRSAGYLVLWSLLAWLLARWSVRQDATEDPRFSNRLQAISGPGMVLVFMAATFASVDWAMSREPHWASTIYGAMWVVGEGLSAFALMLVIATALAHYRVEPMTETATPDRLNDLGSLLLAFIMLWAYMAFSQFMIIWSGNTAEEIPWYLRRGTGPWKPVILALIAFHFVAPFVALLFRESKRRREILMMVAAGVLLMHVVDVIWLVLPATKNPLSPTMDPIEILATLVAVIGLGGAWFASFFWRLGSVPLVPLNDPSSVPIHGAAAAHAGGG